MALLFGATAGALSDPAAKIRSNVGLSAMIDHLRWPVFTNMIDDLMGSLTAEKRPDSPFIFNSAFRSADGSRRDQRQDHDQISA